MHSVPTNVYALIVDNGGMETPFPSLPNLPSEYEGGITWLPHIDYGVQINRVSLKKNAILALEVNSVSIFCLQKERKKKKRKRKKKSFPLSPIYLSSMKEELRGFPTSITAFK